MLPLLFVGVFVAAFAYDFLNTRYIAAVSDRHPHKAACYSVVLWAIGASALLSVFKVSLWLLIPEAIGLYLGTLCALGGIHPALRPSKGSGIAEGCTPLSPSPNSSLP